VAIQVTFNHILKCTYMNAKISVSILASLIFASIFSCKKIDEFNQAPEIQPLRQGFQASAAIGYCASLASTAFHGGSLPANVSFETKTPAEGYTGAGILHIQVSQEYPLPFNSGIGDIYIAGLWNNDSGVISIILADVNLIEGEAKFYGLYTVPVMKKETGKIVAVFAEQDIIIGQGSDTLMNLSLSQPKFATELERLNEPQPTDTFIAIKQNVWFINIDQSGTPSDLYDDAFEINGGGQIAQASSSSGGLLYHAMIETQFTYSNCSINPTHGTAFIQNLKASGSSIDLGNITLDFHSDCDGKAKVVVATGKYVTSNGKNISLGF
jgi:hypothetical protein